MSSMKAVRIHQYGGRETLVFEDAERPDPGADEVLIKTAASSVNPFDWAARNGYVAAYFAYQLPHILGLDVAGQVAAVGPQVHAFKVGDQVYGRTSPARNGAYAEYVALPAGQVAHRPAHLDAVQAASLPQAAISAWTALFDQGGLQAGQRVLIHAAAGGVGSLAVQLAKNHGAQVIGTASGPNLEYLRSLGADQVIDYTTTRFEDAVEPVDLVIDLVGSGADQTLDRSWKTLKPGGMLASLVEYPAPDQAAAHGVRSAMVAANNIDTSFLDKVSRMTADGRLRTTVSAVYPLSEIRQAHEHSEGRHLRGKIGLVVS